MKKFINMNSIFAITMHHNAPALKEEEEEEEEVGEPVKKG